MQLPLTIFARRNFIADFPRKTSTLCFRPIYVLGGLETTDAVLLRLIKKLIVNFLLTIIEIFSLGVTAEVLRANIDCKSAFLKEWVNLGQKFKYKRTSPPIILRVGKTRMIDLS